MRKALIAGFVLFNVLCMMTVNTPDFVLSEWDQWKSSHWEVASVRGISWIFWTLGWYPRLAGIDQRHRMFSTVHRWYTEDRWSIMNEKGEKYPARTAPRWFFDHKRGKFDLNLYSRPFARNAYAQYLCHKNPEIHANAVTRELWYHPFALRTDAARTGSFYASDFVHHSTETFLCVKK